MEEYLQTLREQIRGFSPEEQEALIEEISSHIESGEEDPKMGKDIEQRRKRLMKELGSTEDMSRGFKETYHPNRFIDYLFILIPYFSYPYLNSLYNNLMPRYSWADVRLDIIIHLPLIAIGLWKRSVPLTLFWISLLVSQLFIITTQNEWYYGIQTIIWALLLLGLLILAGYILWKNQNDLLIFVFGLLPLSMCILGSILSVLRLTDYSFYGFIDRSLFIVHSYIEPIGFYGLMVTMALFFLPANRQIRWLALVLDGLMIGLGHKYLNTLMAHWVYMLWAILPLVIVFWGWWRERLQRQQLNLVTS